jgi:hypothetical protein
MDVQRTGASTWSVTANPKLSRAPFRPAIEGTPAALAARLARPNLSSGPEDFHPRALPEPYVNLSIHTAPVVRPLP